MRGQAGPGTARTGTVRRRALAAAAVLALSACGDTSSTTTNPPAASDATEAAASSAPSGAPPSTAAATTPSAPTRGSSDGSSSSAGPGPSSDGAGEPAWEEVVVGLDEPAALFVDPRTGDDLVVQLGGRIVTLDGATVLDLTDRVVRGGEQGLFDAAPTPDGDAVIVHYSGAGDGRTVVSRFPVRPDGALLDAADEQVLLELAQPAANHNGGSVVFGDDGLLYVALGDGGRGNDAFGNGADPGTPLGAILRLDVTSRPGEVVVPDDNPFAAAGRAGQGDERVWAYGVRNPWRIATDGTSWFVADVGQDAVEEVTVVPATPGPHDLGWPAWEGDRCRVDVCEAQSLAPVATLTHADGACSVIGMAVAARPAADDGAAFWTDYCDTRVWRLTPAGEVVADVALPDGVRATALDVDADGFVVALTADGRILRRVRR